MRFGPRVALLSILLLLAASVPVAGGAVGAAALVGPDEAELGAFSTGSAAGATTDGSRHVPITDRTRHVVTADRTRQQDRIPASAVNLTIQLQADGDAQWTVETTFRLRTADDRRAFDDLARSFQRGRANVSFDVETFRQASTAASEATGRSMEIRNVNRSVARTETANYTVGRLRTSFIWTNFARTTGDRMVVDDAFNTTSGTWLPGLTADQRLVISPPPRYSIYKYGPPISVQRGNLVWVGPASFPPGYMDMTFRQTGTRSPTPGTPTPSGPFDPATMGLVAAIVVGMGALALAGYVWTRREPASPSDDDSAVRTAETGPEPASGANEPTGTAEASGSTVEEGEEDEAQEDGVDLELLSDEERVEYLLEQNGGRMKQANIVKETGWSNAKVSQLLSSMEEEGRVDKLRIGRENLITLPDEDVADFDE